MMRKAPVKCVHQGGIRCKTISSVKSVARDIILRKKVVLYAPLAAGILISPNLDKAGAFDAALDGISLRLGKQRVYIGRKLKACFQFRDQNVVWSSDNETWWVALMLPRSSSLSRFNKVNNAKNEQTKRNDVNDYQQAQPNP